MRPKPMRPGLPGGDRTPDPQLRRLLLYPTELRAESERKYGRCERIRTFDPLVPNQMRYQAALRPDEPVFYRPNDPASALHHSYSRFIHRKMQVRDMRTQNRPLQ